MHPYLVTIGLLCCSNVFMTFAWYAHLRDLPHRSWLLAALVSWGIAFFEYMIQVPANRIGHQVMSVGQLKILQEIITLTVFRALRDLLHEGEAHAGLSVGGALPARRGVFPVPEQARALSDFRAEARSAENVHRARAFCAVVGRVST